MGSLMAPLDMTLSDLERSKLRLPIFSVVDLSVYCICLRYFDKLILIDINDTITFDLARSDFEWREICTEQIYLPAVILPLSSGCHKRQFVGRRGLSLSQRPFLLGCVLGLLECQQSYCCGAGSDVRPSTRDSQKPLHGSRLNFMGSYMSPGIFFFFFLQNFNFHICTILFFVFVNMGPLYFCIKVQNVASYCVRPNYIIQLCLTMSAELMKSKFVHRLSSVRPSVCGIDYL